MALEQLVRSMAKSAKIGLHSLKNSLNIISYTLYTTAAIEAAIAISDGSVTYANGSIRTFDILLLGLAGTFAAFGTLGLVSVYRLEDVRYYFDERVCKEHGFTEEIMRNKISRRNAKIYAAYSWRKDEFRRALEHYQI